MAQRLDGPYLPGERAMLKVKRLRTADCGGYRLGSGTREAGSLLLGLAGGPGFTGQAPDGPSRCSRDRSAQWCPLRPTIVVEVCYDQVTGGRFRHGARLLRWRPDKAPRQCTDEQLGREARPSRLALIDWLSEPLPLGRITRWTAALARTSRGAGRLTGEGAAALQGKVLYRREPDPGEN
ncbi:MAG TPA: hypothetical protein VIC29_11590 [Steroidobacteraceae bacterium]